MNTNQITLDSELLDNKEYKLQLNNNNYILYVEIYSEETILLKIVQTDIISNWEYKKLFKYENIIKELYSLKEIYHNIKDVFQFLDETLTKGRFKLIENKQKKTMIISIKLEINFKEMESQISLPQELTSKKEVIDLLINEMNLLKSLEKQNNNDFKNIINEMNEKQNKLIKQNEDNNNKIKELVNLLNNKDTIIKELENKITKISEDKNNKIKELENKIIKNNEDNNNKIKELENKIIKNNKDNNNKIKKLENIIIKNNNEDNNNKIKELENIIINEEHNDNLQFLENKYKNYNKIVNDNKKEMEDLLNNILNISSNNIKQLESQIKNICFNKDIDKIKNKKNQKKQDISNNVIEENNNIEEIKEVFNENPENLEYIETITSNHSSAGVLNNFDVFKGLKDNIEYIAYNNKYNFNLEIIRIQDKIKIQSLSGHTAKTTIIKYYKKNNKKDYLLTCDLSKAIIIWDIQDNFYKKYIFKESYVNPIFDALILFNILQKDYIILSSGGQDEFCKLYELEDKRNIFNNKNLIFKKDIFVKNSTGIVFLIYWLYNNKHYIIECGVYKIIINNIFENEEYATFTYKGKSRCGYVFNDIYLCISALENNSLLIWDLKNKAFYKDIKFEENSGFELICWNNIYNVLGYDKGFIIFNMEELKMIKKINIDNFTYKGVKKMKINNIGECIISSDNKGNIKLFSFKNIK